jgi:hypothetical protein
MPHLTSTELSHTHPIPKTVDTLVVGTGMSGLYSTWRILQKEPGAEILRQNQIAEGAA